MYKFLTDTLNNYQGLMGAIPLFTVVILFASKRVRNFFSKKDILHRMSSYEQSLEEMQRSIAIVVKELTQNGGEGGLKNSTMKDNIGKALRDIKSLKDDTEEQSQDIKELKTNVTGIQVDLSKVQGQVDLLVVDYAKS